MNYEDENDTPYNKNVHRQFQILFLMKVEEIMQLVRHRHIEIEDGFEQLWQLLSNDN